MGESRAGWGERGGQEAGGRLGCAGMWKGISGAGRNGRSPELEPQPLRASGREPLEHRASRAAACCGRGSWPPGFGQSWGWGWPLGRALRSSLLFTFRSRGGTSTRLRSAGDLAPSAGKLRPAPDWQVRPQPEPWSLG